MARIRAHTHVKTSACNALLGETWALDSLVMLSEEVGERGIWINLDRQCQHAAQQGAVDIEVLE